MPPPSAPPGGPAAGLLLTVAAAGCFGGAIAFTRLAALAGVAGLALVAWRVAIMLGLVALVVLVLRRRPEVPRGERGAVAALALATAVLRSAYLSSVAYIPVTVAVVLFYTYPAVIVALTPFVEGRAVSGGLVGVVGLALLGVVLVVGPAWEGLDPRGVGLALLASLATAAQFLAAGRCRATPLLSKVFWVHLLVLPATLVAGAGLGQLQGLEALMRAPLGSGLTILGYLAGFGLQMAALARIRPAAAGLAFCLEPVAAALASVLVLGERLSALQLAGGALVLAAIAANIRLDARRGAGV